MPETAHDDTADDVPIPMEPAPQQGIRCPNCDVRSIGLRVHQERKRTKGLGFGFWLATICTFGLWALLRAIFGRKQIIRYYRCPNCRYQWSP